MAQRGRLRKNPAPDFGHKPISVAASEDAGARETGTNQNAI